MPARAADVLEMHDLPNEITARTCWASSRDSGQRAPWMALLRRAPCFVHVGCAMVGFERSARREAWRITPRVKLFRDVAEHAGRPLLSLGA